ncbi:AMP-binding protein [Saccharothrix sp.]|uniref:AMP-binding protein n=1 Tax=Saccharothrix sp. TaxID=1873460 RepID=UPI002811D41E|nr:AMP-binding protein [Saccharothrix sp.]
MTRTLEALSMVDGGPLPEPVCRDLVEVLRRAAAAGTGGIVHIGPDGEETWSYQDLLADAARVLTGLRAAGVHPGDKVVMQVERAPNLLAAFWACVLGGFVPVPVTTSPPPNSAYDAAGLLAGVWGMLDGAWVLADREFPTSYVGDVDSLRANAPATEFHRPDPDSPAVLLLTSGSTGLPKAVTLTHRNIVSRSAAAAAVRGLTSANRTFNWMPLDHVGGLVMFHARDTYLGCRQVHAPISWVLQDPLRWLDVISAHRCDTTWAPNFAFGLVVDRADRIAGKSWDLSRLGYIMNGGEPIKPRVANRFLSLLAPFGLPSTAMHPGWGMSETTAGVVDCVYPAGMDEDTRFIPVGVPHPGLSLRVVDEAGEVVPEGVEGRLHVTGLPITPGYYNNPEQNAQSFSADGWFKTGDLAYVRNGVLTVTGRVDDVVEIDGVGYFGHEIEAVVEELPFVAPSYTVACPVNGDLVIFYVPRSGTGSDAEAWRIVDHVSTRMSVPVRRVVAVTADQVPKTGIGKLRRSALAATLKD